MSVDYAAAFAVSLVGALVATPVARKVALRLGIVDMPAARKVHTDPVPYLGGVAIILAFVGSMALGVIVHPLSGSYGQVAAILGGGLVLAGMGLIDDLMVVPGWIKVPVEIVVALGLFAAHVRAQPFKHLALDLPLNIGWVVGVTNAVNYQDNMDGLSSGVVAIAAAYFFVMAALSHQVLVASLGAALTGCALGFLWWNRPPARIFMGDAGSLFLGFLLAALGLKLRFDNIDQVTFFVPICVLAVPIIDALMVSVSRVSHGLSPIQPGKDHVSHRLVKIGIPSRAAVGLIYFASASCGWLGVVIAYARPRTAYLLMGWLTAMALFLGWLLLRVKVEYPPRAAAVQRSKKPTRA
ncbi:MAG TPA: MraY family glycosyltransferase [Actinomycetota bacterium]|nr:MraY family glycosyltransferase [Actinomycetota bacterium]